MKLPAIRFIKGKRRAILLETVKVKVNDAVFTIYKGFDSDGASIPRFLWWIDNPWNSNVLVGSFIHDAIYWSKALPRRLADRIFYAVMKQYDTPFLKRLLFYVAVRCFGWIFFYFSKTPSQKEIDKYFKIRQIKKSVL
jgi:hypothetical protein